jgi:hypothetical protein
LTRRSVASFLGEVIMWILIGVILQVGPVAAPPVTLQQAFVSEAACGDAKNDLETQYRRNPSGYRVTIACAQTGGDDKAVVSWRWHDDAHEKSASLNTSP